MNSHIETRLLQKHTNKDRSDSQLECDLLTLGALLFREDGASATTAKHEVGREGATGRHGGVPRGEATVVVLRQ